MLLTSTQINSLLLLRDTIALESAQENANHPLSPNDAYQDALRALELRRLQSMIDAEKLCQEIGKAGQHHYVSASIILGTR